MYLLKHCVYLSGLDVFSRYIKVRIAVLQICYGGLLSHRLCDELMSFIQTDH